MRGSYELLLRDRKSQRTNAAMDSTTGTARTAIQISERKL